MIEINKYIDHTVLKATASEDDIIALCEEASEYEFFSVCVNSGYVAAGKKESEGSKVKVCSVVGFPLGAMSTEAKIFEAEQSCQRRSRRDRYGDQYWRAQIQKLFKKVEDEIADIKKAIGDIVLKVIIETCYLNTAGDHSGQ